MLKERLKEFIASKGFSITSFEVHMGFSNGSLSRPLNSTTSIRVERLEKIFEQYPELDANYLFGLRGKAGGKQGGKVYPQSTNEKGTNHLTLNEPSEPYRTIQPVVVTVDSSYSENIAFVPVKAHAGYLGAYNDPEFIGSLPVFAIPGFQNATFRAFEIEGYSMLPYQGAGLYPSDIVVAQYLESPYEMRDGRVYVIISQNQGIIIKRCLNRITENGKVIAQSDNTNGEYPPIILDLDEIHEVWEFKAKISRQIPRPGDIFSRLDDIEAKLALMNEPAG